MLSAGEFCNRDVVFCHSDDHVVEVARRMRDHHVGTLVVVEESSAGRVPIGIITDRDIVVGLIARDPTRLEQALVRELMGEHLIVVRERDSLYEALIYMRGRGVRRLPVVDDQGALQGIIAFDDLVAHVADEMARLAGLLQREQERERQQRPAQAPPVEERPPLGVFP